MSYLPISNTASQYAASGSTLASGYYLKGYQAGTTTPLSMATDNTGGTTLAKCKLNSQGYPISIPTDDTSVFVPHFNQDYKLVLYTSEADADANTFANADWVIDNLGADTTSPRYAATVATMKTLSVAVGDTVQTGGYYTAGDGGGGRYTIVAGGTGTDDGGSYHDLDNGLQAELVVEGDLNLKVFGVKGDGATEDTSQFQAALNFGGVFYIPAGTYIIDYLTTPVRVTLRGQSRETTIIKRKDSATDNKDMLVNTTDIRVCVYNIHFNGNRDNNTTQGGGNFANGVILAAGSGVIDNCKFTEINNHCIQTGGEDRYFTSNTAEAYDITISNNHIDNGNAASNHGDGIRPVRTNGLYITGNTVLNSYSSIRLNYYNRNVLISDNYCDSNTLDVGITMGLGSDCTITGNICRGALANHGIELAGCKRVTVTGNICEGNTNGNGILLDEYGPPSGANYAGYIDGVLITNPTVVEPEECVVNGNIVKDNNVGIKDISARNCIYSNNVLEGNTSQAMSMEGSHGPVIMNNLFVTGDISWSSYQFDATTQGNRFMQPRTNTVVPTYGDRNVMANKPITEPGTWDVTANANWVVDGGETVFMIDNAVSGSAYNNYIGVTNLKGSYIFDMELRSDIDASTCDVLVQLYNGGAFVANSYVGTGTVLSDTYAKLSFNRNTDDAAAASAFDEVRVSVKALAGQTNDVYVKYIKIYQ